MTSATKAPTQTTGEQKMTRQWLNKYGQYNLKNHVLALLKYLASNCYWQEPEKKFKGRRDFEVSLGTLAKNMYCSPTHAERCVEEAEALGLITIIKSPTGGRNSYALHTDKARVEYQPSKLVKLKLDREKREARNERLRKRRAERAAEDPYADLVAYAVASERK